MFWLYLLQGRTGWLTAAAVLALYGVVSLGFAITALAIGSGLLLTLGFQRQLPTLS